MSGENWRREAQELARTIEQSLLAPARQKMAGLEDRLEQADRLCQESRAMLWEQVHRLERKVQRWQTVSAVGLVLVLLALLGLGWRLLHSG
ncbi:MAG: hypothetical protein ACUVTU_01790 [Desulfurispora sp.]|uniref:hypothetical protein n=1 Tax=Desulfurispora sp. TaxID=3014275 RepID=UPI00404A280C